MLRGGLSAPGVLRENVLNTEDNHGFIAASARIGLNSLDWHLLRTRPRIGNSAYRATTVGALRRAGFDVVLSGSPPHCSILYPVGSLEQAESLHEELSMVFGEPVNNPLKS